MATETREYSVQMPMTFEHLPTERTDDGQERPLILFLHGYTDSGTSLLKRALRGVDLPGDLQFNVLAPNGPFPLPVKTEKGYTPAYAWYFWEFQTNRLVIHPSIAVGMLKSLIKDLGYEKTPKVIVGFSQGGFLTPFLLPELENVKGAIVIGSAFRVEDYPTDILHPVVAIHGAKDQVISIDHARESLAELTRLRGIRSEFHFFEDLDHTIHEAASQLLVERIKSFL